ncbi:MAG: STAS domain-containing protein [Colwellia sp.]|nr:STAS domain-containing protein [Colwellia sp.]
MTIKQNTSEDNANLCHLSIAEELTIYVVLSYQEILTNYLASYDRFALDLSDIEEIDSAGVQLLIAFHQHLKKMNYPLQLLNLSDAVKTIFDRYGLKHDQFCIPAITGEGDEHGE